MEYQALYRKYRPKNLNEVYGQNIAVNILKNAIENKKFGHAYLFTGSRGCGKTSVAKIMARLVNCENVINGQLCGECKNCIATKENSCVDILEIDAASNNGVDEIRELKSKVNLIPSILNYKVYIIDEVHMLSIGAFNALLKTLEEPPNYAVIILVTSKYNSLLNTIRSRSQKLDFTKLKNSDIINYMKDNNYQTNLDQKLILSLIDGSIGNISQVFDNIDAINKLVSFIDNIQNVNAIELNDMAIYLGEQKDNIYMLLDYLETIMYERIKNADISRYIKSIEEAKKNIQGNVNFEICIDKMLLAFEEEQYV